MVKLIDGNEAGVVLVELRLSWKAEPHDRDEANIIFELYLTQKAEVKNP